MAKTIFFYPDGAMPKGHNVNTAHYYSRADYLIKHGVTFHTSQMSFLSSPHTTDYDLLIICESGRTIVIGNNHDGTWSCDMTDQELRHGHDLFRVWESGAFYG